MILIQGYLDGNFEILEFDNEDTRSIYSSKSVLKPLYELDPVNNPKSLHSSSVRKVQFSPDGNMLLTAGSDSLWNLFDCSKTSVVMSKPSAHDHPIYSTLFLDPFNFCSGDDDGHIKLWDLRASPNEMQRSEIYEQQEGTISSLNYLKSENQILATSTNGSLGVYDLRMTNQNQSLKLHAMSDFMESELNDLVVMKDGKLICCGASGGEVQIYHKGWYGDCKDRLTGHPYSVDSMVKLEEDLLLTGSEDGWVRVCGIHPNKVAVFEAHEEEADDSQDFPILKISLSHCKRFLASISTDRCIRFYELGDIRAVLQNRGENMKKLIAPGTTIIQEEDEDDDEEQNNKNKKQNTDLIKKKNFFNDF